MKVKVIMPFKDKNTGKVHNTKEVFECTKDRFNDINKSGRFVVEVKEEEAANKKESK